MNINEALKRIDHLNKNIESIDEALKETRDKDIVKVTILWPGFAPGLSGSRVHVERSLLSELLTSTITANQEELKSIQPVIDMANAALKGVLSDER